MIRSSRNTLPLSNPERPQGIPVDPLCDTVVLAAVNVVGQREPLEQRDS